MTLMILGRETKWGLSPLCRWNSNGGGQGPPYGVDQKSIASNKYCLSVAMSDGALLASLRRRIGAGRFL